MTIAASYRVDSKHYHSPDVLHRIMLATTEYSYRNELLVHLQIGKNMGVRINNFLKYEFKKDGRFHSEQFLLKKSYHEGGAKPMTRSTFEEKLKRFDMSRTAIEQEILEAYPYTGKDGRPDTVRIVITGKPDAMAAGIDFKNGEQHANFVGPAWLMPPDCAEY